MPDRQEVYKAIGVERDYQIKKFGLAGKRPVPEYLMALKSYIDRAINESMDEAMETPQVFSKTLVSVRKITAIGVACMEQHGAPVRDMS